MTPNRPLQRVVAWLILLAFSFEQIAAADVFSAPSSDAQIPVLSPLAARPSAIELPEGKAVFREAHAGANGKLIVLIQDAHLNLSGQRNLAATLDHLIARYGISTVFVEGSDRESTLDVIKPAATPEEWQIAAKRLLYDGAISGDEFLNLTSGHPMRLFGVEYGDLYELNVQAYAELKSNMEAVTEYLRRIDVALGRVKSKLYPKTLIEYERLQSGRAIEASLGKSAEYLLAKAGEEGLVTEEYAQLRRMIALKASESAIEFEKANAAARGDAAGDAGALAELRKYEAYAAEFKRLRTEALVDELDRLEQDYYERELRTRDQRTVRAIDRYAGLLRKAYTISMSSDEFRTFLANEAEFHTVSWQAFLNQKLVELGFNEDIVPFKSVLEDAEAHLLNFYRIVDQRDHAFVENMNRILAAENLRAAFLVAGGYHTKHLTRLLREQGTSYAVLAPVIEQETDIKKYEELLLASFRPSRNTLNVRKLIIEPQRLERYAGGVYPLSAERIRDIGSALASAGARRPDNRALMQSRLPDRAAALRLLEETEWNFGTVRDRLGLSRIDAYLFCTEHGLLDELRAVLLKRLDAAAWSKVPVGRQFGIKGESVGMLIDKLKLTRPTEAGQILKTLNDGDWKIGALRSQIGIANKGDFYEYFRDHGLLGELREKLRERLDAHKWAPHPVADDFGTDRRTIQRFIRLLGMEAPAMSKADALQVLDQNAWNIRAASTQLGIRRSAPNVGLYKHFETLGLLPELKTELKRRLEEKAWSSEATAKAMGISTSMVNSLKSKFALEKPQLSKEQILRILDSHDWNYGKARQDLQLTDRSAIYSFFEANGLLPELRSKLESQLSKSNWSNYRSAEALGISTHAVEKLMEIFKLQRPTDARPSRREYNDRQRDLLGRIQQSYEDISESDDAQGSRAQGARVVKTLLEETDAKHIVNMKTGNLDGKFPLPDGRTLSAILGKGKKLSLGTGSLQSIRLRIELRDDKRVYYVLPYVKENGDPGEATFMWDIEKQDLIRADEPAREKRGPKSDADKARDLFDKHRILDVAITLSSNPEEMRQVLAVLLIHKGVEISSKEFYRLTRAFVLNLREGHENNKGPGAIDPGNPFDYLRALMGLLAEIEQLDAHAQNILIRAFLRLSFRRFSEDYANSLAQVKEIVAGRGEEFVERFVAQIDSRFGQGLKYQPAHIKTELLPHQRVGAWQMRTSDELQSEGVYGFLLEDDTRMGKTIQTLAAIDPAWRVVLAVPAGVMGTWQEQHVQHTNGANELVLIRGPSHEAKMKMIRDYHRKKGVILVLSLEDLPNYSVSELEEIREGLPAEEAAAVGRGENPHRSDLIAVDEGQRIENYSGEGRRSNAQVASAIHKLADTVSRRWVLSASPFTSNETQLFSELHLIHKDPKTGQVTNALYASRREFKQLLTGGLAARKWLYALKAQVSLRRTKSDMPHLYTQKNEVDPAKEGEAAATYEQSQLALRIIKNLGEYLNAYNENMRRLGKPEKQFAQTSVGVFLKLQFLNWAFTTPGFLGEDIPTVFWDAMDRSVLPRIEAGKPGIIYAQNTDLIVPIAEHYRNKGYKVAQIYGDVTGKAYDENGKPIVDANGNPVTAKDHQRHLFQNDPEYKLVVMNIRAGVGINLNRARWAYYAQPPENYVQFLQSADRTLGLKATGYDQDPEILWYVPKYDEKFLAEVMKTEDRIYVQHGSPSQLIYRAIHGDDKARFDTVMEGLEPDEQRASEEEGLSRIVQSIHGFLEDPSMKKSQKIQQQMRTASVFYPMYQAVRGDAANEEVVLDLLDLHSRVDVSPVPLAASAVEAIGAGTFEPGDLAWVSALRQLSNKQQRDAMIALAPQILSKFWTSGSRVTLNRLIERGPASLQYIAEEQPQLLLPFVAAAHGWNAVYDESEDVYGFAHPGAVVLNELVLEFFEDGFSRYDRGLWIKRLVHALIPLIDLERDVFLTLYDRLGDDLTSQNFSIQEKIEFFEQLAVLAQADRSAAEALAASTGGFAEARKAMNASMRDTIVRMFGLPNTAQTRERLLQLARDEGELNTPVMMMTKLLSGGEPFAEHALIFKEIFRAMLDGTYSTRRNAEQSLHPGGIKLDYRDGDKGLWETFTRHELVRLGEVRVNPKDFRNARKKSLQRLLGFFTDPAAMQEAFGQLGSQIIADLSDPSALERLRGDKTREGTKLGRLKKAGTDQQAIAASEALNLALDTRIHALEFADAVRADDVEAMTKTLRAVRGSVARPAEGAEDAGLLIATALAELDTSLAEGEKARTFHEVEIEFTDDPYEILKRGMMHEELRNCFNLAGGVHQVATLVNDLASRNVMLAIVRVQDAPASVAIVRVMQAESGEPVLHVERPLYRWGHAFEKEIALALRKAKPELLNVPVTGDTYKNEKKKDSFTVAKTGTIAPTEYFETLFGWRRRENRVSHAAGTLIAAGATGARTSKRQAGRPGAAEDPLSVLKRHRWNFQKASPFLSVRKSESYLHFAIRNGFEKELEQELQARLNADRWDVEAVAAKFGVGFNVIRAWIRYFDPERNAPWKKTVSILDKHGWNFAKAKRDLRLSDREDFAMFVEQSGIERELIAKTRERLAARDGRRADVAADLGLSADVFKNWMEKFIDSWTRKEVLGALNDADWKVSAAMSRLGVAKKFLSFLRRHDLAGELERRLRAALERHDWNVQKAADELGTSRSTADEWIKRLRLERPGDALFGRIKDAYDDLESGAADENTAGARSAILAALESHDWNIGDARTAMGMKPGEKVFSFFERHGLLDELKAKLTERMQARNYVIDKVAGDLGINNSTANSILKKLGVPLGLALDRESALRVLEENEWNIGRARSELGLKHASNLYDFFDVHGLLPELEAMLQARMLHRKGSIRRVARDFGVATNFVNQMLEEMRAPASELSRDEMLQILEEAGWNVGAVKHRLGMNEKTRIDEYFEEKGMTEELKTKLTERLAHRAWAVKTAAADFGISKDTVVRLIKLFGIKAPKLSKSETSKILERHGWNVGAARFELSMNHDTNIEAFFKEAGLWAELGRKLEERLIARNWAAYTVADDFGLTAPLVLRLIEQHGLQKPKLKPEEVLAILEANGWNIGASKRRLGITHQTSLYGFFASHGLLEALSAKVLERLAARNGRLEPAAADLGIDAATLFRLAGRLKGRSGSASEEKTALIGKIQSAYAMLPPEWLAPPAGARRSNKPKKNETQPTLFDIGAEQSAVPAPVDPKIAELEAEGVTFVKVKIGGVEHTVWGIGHSREDIRPIDKFMELLRKAGVQTIVDVRTRPYSQYNPAFNLKKMTERFVENGFEYVHLGENLGGKNPGYDHFRDFIAANPDGRFTKGVVQLLQTIQSKPGAVALMCSEKKLHDCHREQILEHLAKIDADAALAAGQSGARVLREKALEILNKKNWNIGKAKKALGMGANEPMVEYFESVGLLAELKSKLEERAAERSWSLNALSKDFGVDKQAIGKFLDRLQISNPGLTKTRILQILESNGWNIRKSRKELQLFQNTEVIEFFKEHGLLPELKARIDQRIEVRGWSVKAISRDLGVGDKVAQQFLDEFDLSKSDLTKERILEILERNRWNILQARPALKMGQTESVYAYFQKNGLLPELKAKIEERIAERGWTLKAIAKDLGLRLSVKSMAGLLGDLQLSKTDLTKARILQILEHNDWNIGNARAALQLNLSDNVFDYFKEHGLLPELKAKLEALVAEHGSSVLAVGTELGLGSGSVDQLFEEFGLRQTLTKNRILEILGENGWDFGKSRKALRVPRTSSVFDYFKHHELLPELKAKLEERAAAHGGNLRAVAKDLGLSSAVVQKFYETLGISGLVSNRSALMRAIQASYGNLSDRDGDSADSSGARVNIFTALEQNRWDEMLWEARVPVKRTSADLYRFFKSLQLLPQLRSKFVRAMRENDGDVERAAASLGLAKTLTEGLIRRLGIRMTIPKSELLAILDKHGWNIGAARKELRMPEGDIMPFFQDNDLVEELKAKFKAQWSRGKQQKDFMAAFGLSQSKTREAMAALRIEPLWHPKDDARRIFKQKRWNFALATEALEIESVETTVFYALDIYKLGDELKPEIEKRLKAMDWSRGRAAESFGVSTKDLERMINRLKIEDPQTTMFGRIKQAYDGLEDSAGSRAAILKALDKHDWNIRRVMKIAGSNKKGNILEFFRQNGLEEELKKELTRRLEARDWVVNHAADDLGVKGDTIKKWMQAFGIEKPGLDRDEILKTLNRRKWNIRSAGKQIGLGEKADTLAFFRENGLEQEFKTKLLERLTATHWTIKRTGAQFGVSYLVVMRWIDELGLQKPESDRNQTFEILERYQWDIGKAKPQLTKFGLKKRGGFYEFFKQSGLIEQLKAKVRDSAHLRFWVMQEVARDFGLDSMIMSRLIESLELEVEDRTRQKALEILTAQNWDLNGTRREMGLPEAYHDYDDFFVKLGLERELKAALTERLQARDWNVSDVIKELKVSRRVLERWIEKYEIKKSVSSEPLEVLEKHGWNIAKARPELDIRHLEKYYDFFKRHALLAPLRRQLTARLRARGWVLETASSDLGIAPTGLASLMDALGIQKPVLTKSEILKILSKHRWNIGKARRDLGLKRGSQSTIYEYFEASGLVDELRAVVERRLRENDNVMADVAREFGVSKPYMGMLAEKLGEREMDRSEILKILEKHDWKIIEARKELGISRSERIYAYFERNGLVDELRDKMRRILERNEWSDKALSQHTGIVHIRHLREKLGIEKPADQLLGRIKGAYSQIPDNAGSRAAALEALEKNDWNLRKTLGRVVPMRPRRIYQFFEQNRLESELKKMLEARLIAENWYLYNVSVQFGVNERDVEYLIKRTGIRKPDPAPDKDKIWRAELLERLRAGAWDERAVAKQLKMSKGSLRSWMKSFKIRKAAPKPELLRTFERHGWNLRAAGKELNVPPSHLVTFFADNDLLADFDPIFNGEWKKTRTKKDIQKAFVISPDVMKEFFGALETTYRNFSREKALRVLEANRWNFNAARQNEDFPEGRDAPHFIAGLDLVDELAAVLESRLAERGGDLKAVAADFGVSQRVLREMIEDTGAADPASALLSRIEKSYGEIEGPSGSRAEILKVLEESDWNFKEARAKRRDLIPYHDIHAFLSENGLLEIFAEKLTARLVEAGWARHRVARQFGIGDTLLESLASESGVYDEARQKEQVLRALDRHDWNFKLAKSDLQIANSIKHLSYVRSAGIEPEFTEKLRARLDAAGWSYSPVAAQFGVKNGTIKGWIDELGMKPDREKALAVLAAHDWNVQKAGRELGIHKTGYLEAFKERGLLEPLKQKLIERLDSNGWTLSATADAFGVKNRNINEWIETFGLKPDPDSLGHRIAEAMHRSDWNVAKARKSAALPRKSLYAFFASVGLEHELRRKLAERLEARNGNFAAVGEDFGVSDGLIAEWAAAAAGKKEEPIDREKALQILDRHRWNLAAAEPELAAGRYIYEFLDERNLLPELKTRFDEALGPYRDLAAAAAALGLSAWTASRWAKKLGLDAGRSYTRDEVLSSLRRHDWNIARVKEELKWPSQSDTYAFFEKHGVLPELKSEIERRLAAADGSFNAAAAGLGVVWGLLRKWAELLGVGAVPVAAGAILAILEANGWNIGAVQKEIGAVKKKQGIYGYFAEKNLLGPLKSKFASRLSERHWNVPAVARDFGLPEEVMRTWIVRFELVPPKQEILRILESKSWNIEASREEIGLMAKGRLHRFFEQNGLLPELKAVLERRLAENNWEMNATAASLGINKGDTLAALVQRLEIRRPGDSLLDRIKSSYDGIDAPSGSRAEILAVLEKHAWNIGAAKEELRPWSGKGNYNVADFFARYGLAEELKTKIIERIEAKKWSIAPAAAEFGLSSPTLAAIMKALGIERPLSKEKMLAVLESNGWNIAAFKKSLDVHEKEHIYNLFETYGMLPEFKAKLVERLEANDWTIRQAALDFAVHERLVAEAVERLNIQMTLTRPELLVILNKHDWKILAAKKELRVSHGDSILEFFEHSGLSEEFRAKLEERLAARNWAILTVARDFDTSENVIRDAIAHFGLVRQGIKKEDALAILEANDWNFGASADALGFVNGRGGVYGYLVKLGIVDEFREVLAQRIGESRWQIRPVARQFGLDQKSAKRLLAAYGLVEPSMTPEETLRVLEENDWNIGAAKKTLRISHRMDIYAFVAASGVGEPAKRLVQARLEANKWNYTLTAPSFGIAPSTLQSLAEGLGVAKKVSKEEALRILEANDWNVARSREELHWNSRRKNTFDYFRDAGLLEELKKKTEALLIARDWKTEVVAKDMGLSSTLIHRFMHEFKLVDPRKNLIGRIAESYLEIDGETAAGSRAYVLDVLEKNDWNAKTAIYKLFLNSEEAFYMKLMELDLLYLLKAKILERAEEERPAKKAQATLTGAVARKFGVKTGTMRLWAERLGLPKLAKEQALELVEKSDWNIKRLRAEVDAATFYDTRFWNNTSFFAAHGLSTELKAKLEERLNAHGWDIAAVSPMMGLEESDTRKMILYFGLKSPADRLREKIQDSYRDLGDASGSRAAILETLERHDWNLSEAGAEVGFATKDALAFFEENGLENRFRSVLRERLESREWALDPVAKLFGVTSGSTVIRWMRALGVEKSKLASDEVLRILEKHRWNFGKARRELRIPVRGSIPDYFAAHGLADVFEAKLLARLDARRWAVKSTAADFGVNPDAVHGWLEHYAIRKPAVDASEALATIEKHQWNIANAFAELKVPGNRDILHYIRGIGAIPQFKTVLWQRLEQAKWNQDEVAVLYGVSTVSVRRWIDEFKWKRPMPARGESIRVLDEHNWNWAHARAELGMDETDGILDFFREVKLERQLAAKLTERLAASQWSSTRAAEQFGVSPATVEKWIELLNVTKQKPPRKETLRILKQNDWNFRKVRKELEISRSTDFLAFAESAGIAEAFKLKLIERLEEHQWNRFTVSKRFGVTHQKISRWIAELNISRPELSKNQILKILAAHDWNVRAAQKKLGIHSRQNFYEYFEKHALLEELKAKIVERLESRGGAVYSAAKDFGIAGEAFKRLVSLLDIDPNEHKNKLFGEIEASYRSLDPGGSAGSRAGGARLLPGGAEFGAWATNAGEAAVHAAPERAFGRKLGELVAHRRTPRGVPFAFGIAEAHASVLVQIGGEAGDAAAPVALTDAVRRTVTVQVANASAIAEAEIRTAGEESIELERQNRALSAWAASLKTYSGERYLEHRLDDYTQDPQVYRAVLQAFQRFAAHVNDPQASGVQVWIRFTLGGKAIDALAHEGEANAMLAMRYLSAAHHSGAFPAGRRVIRDMSLEELKPGEDLGANTGFVASEKPAPGERFIQMRHPLLTTAIQIELGGPEAPGPQSPVVALWREASGEPITHVEIDEFRNGTERAVRMAPRFSLKPIGAQIAETIQSWLRSAVQAATSA